MAGCVRTRAAARFSASGSRAHSATSSAASAGSRAMRLAPSRRASRPSASGSVSSPTGTGTAPSSAIRPVSWLRLVTRTRHSVVPDSNGLTWSLSRALSSRISIRFPASDAPVQADLAAKLGRDARGRYAEGGQEAAYYCRGALWRISRVEPAQIRVELAIGKATGVLVRPVHGQGGLADSGGSADRQDYRPRHCRAMPTFPAQMVRMSSSAFRPVKCQIPAGSWRGGSAGLALGGGTGWLAVPGSAGSAAASAGSAASIRWCRFCRPGPGSTPSSRTRTSRARR